jgi:hypothetical protein
MQPPQNLAMIRAQPCPRDFSRFLINGVRDDRKCMHVQSDTRALNNHRRPPVYFCDSRSPWQRGTNENTNGLLRDYFPKGVSFANHRRTCWLSNTNSTIAPEWSSKTVVQQTYSPLC